MINKQTTLDLNGPILSILTNPLPVTVPCSTSPGIATFVGLATATFPNQSPSNSATPTGSISYRWYLDSYGALTDGTIAGLGITVAGSTTTTLTISNIINPNITSTNVYFTADYIPSAYGQAPITVGTARSTGNAINDPFPSAKARLVSNPNITVSRYPEIATSATESIARFNITASTTELDASALSYQWYANGVGLADGSNSVVVQSPIETITTTTVPGYNGPGIYLDLSNVKGMVDVTFSMRPGGTAGFYGLNINIPGVASFLRTVPVNPFSQTVEYVYNLQGGRVYGPCIADHQNFTVSSGRNLYIGSEIIGTVLPQYANNISLAVTDYDINLVSFYPFGLPMYLSISQGTFMRLGAPITTSVPIISTGPVNAINTVTGATSPNLAISCNIVGIQTVQCRVSHPTACNSPLYSNTVNLNVLKARPVINIETFVENGSSLATLRNLDLDVVERIDLNANNTSELTSLYAAERDIDVIMEIYGAKGADAGGYSGGQGGSSTISFTMKKNDEYVIARIPQENTNGGIFVYRKSKLLVACGSGGNAGTSGNGGDGGGVNVAGAIGNGRGAGTGGALIPVGSLSPNGIFGSVSNSPTILSGDSIASVPNGGRTISCPKGNYWRTQGYSACEDVGTVAFYRPDGSIVSNTATISRGFKSGYSILTTSGAGTGNSGNGGGGVTGGAGGTGNAGGGGGSGYSDGSVSIIETRQGGNTGVARIGLYENIPRTYVITASATNVNEGSSVTFTLNTTRVPNGTTLYWQAVSSNSSVAFNLNLVSSTITVNNNTAQITITANADSTTEGIQSFSIDLYKAQNVGGILASSPTITINDTSQTPPVYYSEPDPYPYCPAPWTKILMADGTHKNAGDLKVGDILKTQHEHTLEWGEYPVLKVNIVQQDRFKLKFDHTDFVCSPSHRMYIENKGWTKVSDMAIGDIISGHILLEIGDYEYGDVVAIEVGESHTYISEGLLSHNLKIISGGTNTSSTPSWCPAPWTKILMADGNLKNAGDLKVGDILKTQHEHTLEWGEYPVSKVSIAQQDRIQMKFDHVDFVCSPSHRMYVENKGWIKVSDMVIGDVISGHTLLEINDYEYGDVVSIEVEESHTYISEGLLSHNLKLPPTTERVNDQQDAAYPLTYYLWSSR